MSLHLKQVSGKPFVCRLTWFVVQVAFRSTLGRHVAQIDLLVHNLNLEWETRNNGNSESIQGAKLREVRLACSYGGTDPRAVSPPQPGIRWRT